jgi:hypothetical protein
MSAPTIMCNRVIDVIDVLHYQPHTHARTHVKPVSGNYDYIGYIDYTPERPDLEESNGRNLMVSNATYPKANAKIIQGVSRLGSLFAAFPEVMPTEDSPAVLPLKIHIAADLYSRITPPHGMKPAAARAIVADVLRRYTSTPEYRKALATPGAWRHDIDGNPVEPVSQDHADFARQVPPEPKKEIIDVQVPAIKVTLPLRPDQLHAVDDLVKNVDVRLDLGDGVPFTVPFSGRNYRRALRQVDEMKAGGGEVIVLLQGRLIAGHRIEGAGLSVQAKLPKAGG